MRSFGTLETAGSRDGPRDMACSVAASAAVTCKASQHRPYRCLAHLAISDLRILADRITPRDQVTDDPHALKAHDIKQRG